MKKFLLAGVLLVAVVACKKSGHFTHPTPWLGPGVQGKWIWVETDMITEHVGSMSGIQKTMTFTNVDTGVVYITHNDSIAGYVGPAVSVPATMLPSLVTDTVAYSFNTEPDGCPTLKQGTFEALVINKEVYQFFLVGDTLKLAAAPCLAQPDTVKYVRVQ